MKKLLYLIFIIMISHSQAQQTGDFSNTIDIGSPVKTGNTVYDADTQEYTLTGGGYNIWFERDEFHYAFNQIAGDFILTANFAFEGEGVDPHRKVGWMIRETEGENSAHISATLHGDGLTVLQWRPLKGAFMRDPEDQVFAQKTHYSIIQLERKGNQVIMRAAHEGEPLQVIGSRETELPKEVLAGLFVCSHNPDVSEKARIWNVRIDQPFDLSESNTLGSSRLEVMNVFNGNRRIVYSSDEGFEAPNWTIDGQSLIFNQSGSIMKIPVAGGQPTKVNTGEATRNNNDHGISFDGKLLAISSHVEGKPGGGSTIYVVPVEGGTPKQVTEFTPSYWHGWNPNNKEVVYVAQREGDTDYNIFEANIETGKEKQLTFNVGSHVDGPEYDPAGKFIYYNGSQSGTMQLWRMKPDGSGKEQLTFDENNDWFPHISPDGKWIAFISFPPTIPVNGHPRNQKVELKLMPVSGGPPKTIAYLYGGQGTINVPSWSPDSQSIAFVSYRGRK